MRSSIRSLCAGALLAASVVMVSCSNKITDEQLATIKELKKKQSMLNDDISKKGKDLASVQSEISARKVDMNKCSEKRSFVQDKLSRWPNVWPDYTEQPAPVDTVSTTTKKKQR